jgi:hypothetical protein
MLNETYLDLKLMELSSMHDPANLTKVINVKQHKTEFFLGEKTI